MSDVQKELHQLREKVAEIANDETKNENISRLKKEQTTYKSEALRLLGESDDCRKLIRSLVRQTYALGKYSISHHIDLLLYNNTPHRSCRENTRLDA